MTISATADAVFEPPRVQVDVSVPSGNLMTAVSVWRNDSSGRSLVREQPSAGFESRSVFDYECPYGQSVTYDWTATYYDPAASAETFSEPWTTFPGSWTGDTGDASISANRVTIDGGDGASAEIIRSGLDVEWDSISIEYLDSGTSDRGYTVQMFSGSNSFKLAEFNGFVVIGEPFFALGGTVPLNITDVPADDEFVISRTATGFAVRGSVTGEGFGSTDLTGNLSQIRLKSGNETPKAVAVIGAITAETVSTTTDLAEESSAVTLTPTAAWLIAPQAPALSFPLSNTNQQAAGIRTINPITNGSNTTVHRILGTTIPVTTTTGNRQADTLSTTIYTHTSDERSNLRALLAPDLPILINVPPAWDIDLTYGFYQVGDVTETRPYTLGGVPMRDFELPLIRVRSPEVNVENPGWSYAQVASVWATYTDLLNNYDTYADLTVDNRN